MTYLRRILLGLGLLTLMAGFCGAAEQLYDQQADAHQQVNAAIAEASRTGKNVVLVFGANW